MYRHTFTLVLWLAATVAIPQVTVNVQNRALREVLKEIEKVSNYKFFYNESLPGMDKRVSVNASEEDIANVMDQVLAGTEIGYSIDENNLIVLVKKNEPATGTTVTQQGLVVKGRITDSSGKPVIGATIVVKENQALGTVSDIDGNFSLNVPNGATLVISYIGYKTQEINTSGRSNFNIVLSEDTQQLEEIVVVGYGTLDRREVTSSITSIKNTDMLSGSFNNPLQAIKGKVTNLSVVNTNGADPNSGVSLQLRGVNSVNAGQGPLIVVDGIPGGNINDIQKEDIVSIDVLKDASAAAIYGTRGSGGVILVTTKQAKAGETTVSFTSELTMETIRRKAEVLSAEEFVEEGRGSDFGAQTDWFDEVTRNNPLTQRYALSLSGGTDKFKVYTSLYHRDAKGVAIESGRMETGGRINVDYGIWDNRLQFSARASYSDITAERAPNSMFMMAMKLNPTIPVYDESNPTGYNVLLGGWEEWNPVADVRLMEDNGEYKNFLTNFSTKFLITPELNTSLNVGIKSNDQRDIYWRSAEHKASRDNAVRGFARMENRKWNDKTLDWLFNYNKEINNHYIKAVAGYSFQEFAYDGFWAENQDFPVDGVKWWDMQSGTYLSEGRANLDSYKNPRERLIAFLGRVNYSYKDKYMATASARYEGISKLAPENRWGLFPAISAGWRISSEEFMENVSFLNDLKIRVGYGRTGNADFGAGVVTRMYAPDTWWLSNGTWFKTYGLAHNVNKDLKWEEKDEYNIGIDFALLNNKLSGKFDVYKRKVNGLIYDISVPQPPAVHDKMTVNSGNLENSGFEFELTAVPVQNRDLNYSTTLRASHNKTKLISLWGSQTYWDRKGFEAPGSPGTAVRLVAGEDIGRFYIWKFAGFDDDGNWLLYDKDNNVIPANQKSQEDKRFIGNAIPDLILSWDNNITWKKFDMNLYFRSWIGHDVFNKVNMYYGIANVPNQNVLRLAYEKNADIKGEKELCDYWLEDGSFLKLDALSLGYTFTIPGTENYIRNIRASITGRDIFCLTGYSGLDPEVNINGLDPGFEERDVYPKIRSFTFGLQVNF